jgi:hypothetical protein
VLSSGRWPRRGCCRSWHGARRRPPPRTSASTSTQRPFAA